MEGMSMATAKKERPEEVLSEEMVEAAKASAKASTERIEEARAGVGVRRRRGSSAASNIQPSEIPYPTDVHGEDFLEYGPQGYASSIPDDAERAPYSIDQEFIIDPEKVKTLSFDRPGRNLPKKRLYNIKAIHKDGRIVQLPFEEQIQNNAGGDPEDAIGLRRYQRKGIKLLIDMMTLVPIYCAAWDCWAEAEQDGQFVGFCSERHATHTLPNMYKDAGAITRGIFGEGATTSRTWSV
jgi:hypothetical protein